LARADNVPRPALWADLELTLPLARTRAIADWLIGQYSIGLADAIESIIAGQLSAEQSDALLDRLLAESAGFRRAIAGLRAAIVGPTNAGKSSLFNALAGAEAAIVSEQPGTTRDYVTRWASVGGLAVELIDTAGLRSQPSELESRASELADPIVRSADVRLIVLDGTQSADSIAPAGLAALDEFARIPPVIWVINKCDQPSVLQPDGLVGRYGVGPAIRVSALTGAGLSDLATALRVAFGIADLSPGWPGLFTDRQSDLVAAARREAGDQRGATLLQILNS
jgi:tRNA modification GTPase